MFVDVSRIIFQVPQLHPDQVLDIPEVFKSILQIGEQMEKNIYQHLANNFSIICAFNSVISYFLYSLSCLNSQKYTENLNTGKVIFAIPFRGQMVRVTTPLSRLHFSTVSGLLRCGGLHSTKCCGLSLTAAVAISSLQS